MGLQVDWRFIQRINGIPSASSIRPGQNLKLVTGPFHAKVTKSTYRIDLFQGDGEEQVFVRSYRVGLGEFDSTPVGLFIVRRNSKLVNPTWINPRTREFYSADNPENPIGERWIGLEGVEERTKDLSGLGIHGTIAPNTIGTQASMGCIRMGVDDVAQVYEMLSESVSTVEIR
jgi:lipoprotein-anchoring transpeptidase ErfK/SrfK